MWVIQVEPWIWGRGVALRPLFVLDWLQKWVACEDHFEV